MEYTLAVSDVFTNPVDHVQDGGQKNWKFLAYVSSSVSVYGKKNTKFVRKL